MSYPRDWTEVEGLVTVRSREEGDRLMLGGGRLEMRGKDARVIPELSRGALDKIRFGQMPPASGHDDKLFPLMKPGTDQWSQFFSTRKIVEREMPNGEKVVNVTSNLNEVMSRDLDSGAQWLPGDRPARKYLLAQFLSDTYLHEKYCLDNKMLATMRNLALSDPDAAARRLQAIVRATEGNEKATVSAGNYSRSRKWAKSSIMRTAGAYQPLTVTIESRVIGENIILYGPDGIQSWSVMGPIWLAGVLRPLFHMVCHAGTSPVMFALGTECTLLGIEIYNGSGFESPSVRCHAGLHDNLPDASSVATSSLLSQAGREKLASTHGSLACVYVDGEAVATAVRVSPKYVLVNAHVLDLGEQLVIDGVDAEPYRMISRDLWLVKARADEETAWSLRDAVPGEAVIICYRKYDQVNYSSPLSVRASDGVSLAMSTSRELQAGMSGGAVLALSDFALLGVYEGIGPSTALALAFSQTHFTDMCSADEVSVMSHDDARAEDGVYGKMKKRGLGKLVDAALGSMVPMYNNLGVHVGMSYSVDGIMYTTCDPNMPLVAGLGKVQKEFAETQTGHVYSAEALDPSISGVMLTRKPMLMESVFVIGRDSEGPYCSSAAAKVVHVGLSARQFFVDQEQEDALPLVGGLVMATTDGAALGIYQSRYSSQSLGDCGRCVPLPQRLRSVSPSVEPLDVTVQRIFPMLRPGLWPQGILQEVFTHSSAGSPNMTALAYVGDSAIKLATGIELRGKGLPGAEWQRQIQATQSNAALAAIAEKLRVVEYIKTGIGVSLPKGSKVHADLMEAIAGVVYMHETFDTFRNFCRFIGVLGYEEVS